MLYTKSFLKPVDSSDGTRISVVSRDTFYEAHKVDPRLNLFEYDLWLCNLAVPAKLIDNYLKKELLFDEFTKGYLDYLRQDPISKQVLMLGERCLEIDVTLLCTELEPDYCHRKLLAEECQRLHPQLKIEHR